VTVSLADISRFFPRLHTEDIVLSMLKKERPERCHCNRIITCERVAVFDKCCKMLQDEYVTAGA
jgi:hypothetical protein